MALYKSVYYYYYYLRGILLRGGRGRSGEDGGRKRGGKWNVRKGEGREGPASPQ